MTAVYIFKNIWHKVRSSKQVSVTQWHLFLQHEGTWTLLKATSADWRWVVNYTVVQMLNCTFSISVTAAILWPLPWALDAVGLLRMHLSGFRPQCQEMHRPSRHANNGIYASPATVDLCFPLLSVWLFSSLWGYSSYDFLGKVAWNIPEATRRINTHALCAFTACWKRTGRNT